MMCELSMMCELRMMCDVSWEWYLSWGWCWYLMSELIDVDNLWLIVAQAGGNYLRDVFVYNSGRLWTITSSFQIFHNNILSLHLGCWQKLNRKTESMWPSRNRAVWWGSPCTCSICSGRLCKQKEWDWQINSRQHHLKQSADDDHDRLASWPTSPVGRMSIDSPSDPVAAARTGTGPCLLPTCLYRNWEEEGDCWPLSRYSFGDQIFASNWIDRRLDGNVDMLHG